MTVQWDDFREGVTDPRFILPVWTFHFDIQYVPTAPDSSQLQAVHNLIASTAVSAIRDIPGCPISAISIRSGSLPSQDEPDEASQRAFFTLVNGTPVYDFQLQVGPKTFRLTKHRTSLADLIATVPILEEIAQNLFVGRRRAGNGQEDPPLVQILGLQGRIHRANFTFAHRLRTQTYITRPNVEVTTDEIIRKLINTELGAGDNAQQQSPLGVLQLEQIIRGDVTLSFAKTIRNRRRHAWVVLECPFNITQKDIDIGFDYRCGDDGTAIEDVDISDWSVPFIDFYRDLILNRFLPALLHDISVEPRLF